MRLSDGRLSAAAIFVLLVAFLAVDAIVSFERLFRLFRAQFAEHALAVISLVVVEQQLVFFFFRRPQRRFIRIPSESEQRRFVRPDPHEHARRQLRIAVGRLLRR